MKLTKEIFEKGRSSRGGWNNKQLEVLGVGNYKHNKWWTSTRHTRLL